MPERAIPLVDLQDFESGDAVKVDAFVSKLAAAFHNVGFVGVLGHGIPNTLIDDFYVSAKKFFSLKDDIKRKYELPGAAGQRGYTSFGKEHAKGSHNPDLKEFFQIGQECESMKAINDVNPAVPDVPDFMELGMRLYREFERCGASLLTAIAIHLGLPREFFQSRTSDGISILRAIHYPPITKEPASAIRAEQHEDINLITLLVGASAGGLQVKNQQGEWVEVIPQSGEIVINVGDMLQRITNHYLKSTTHRVVNPSREEWNKPRLSIPFFMHPRPDVTLEIIERCVSDENPARYPPVKAIEYLNERLREIGLM